MNLSLKKALIDKMQPAYKTAIAAGINPNKVSRFISGLSEPNQEERKILSKVLGKPESDLFPKVEISA